MKIATDINKINFDSIPIEFFWNINNQRKGHTDKLVFSFIDINSYRKVQRNLIKETSQFTIETIENSVFTNKQKN